MTILASSSKVIVNRTILKILDYLNNRIQSIVDNRLRMFIQGSWNIDSDEVTILNKRKITGGFLVSPLH